MSLRERRWCKRVEVTKLFFVVAVVAQLAAGSTVATSVFHENGWGMPGRVNHTLAFRHQLHPAVTNASEVYQVGQQVRVELRGPNCSSASVNGKSVDDDDDTAHHHHRHRNCFEQYMNTSNGRFGVRVRIAAAHAGRGSGVGPSGEPAPIVPCSEVAPNDVWLETRDLTALGAAAGPHMSLRALFTFHIPPFPFQVCVYYDPPREHEREARRASRVQGWHQSSPMVVGVPHAAADGVHLAGRPSIFVWDAPQTISERDFGGVRVTRRPSISWSSFPFGQTVPRPEDPQYGDSVKLVPAGHPCSYDPPHRDNVSGLEHCGTFMLLEHPQQGSWRNLRCIREGAVERGVGKIGTRRLNPFVDPMNAGFPHTHQGAANASEELVAYFQFPKAGVYDICFSPQEWRRHLQRQRQPDAPGISLPVWFKLPPRPDSSVGEAVGAQRLHITRRNTTMTLPRFSLTGPPHALAWGAVRVVAGVGASLSTLPSRHWDPKCVAGVECWKEYFMTSTTGGDTFRLVPESRFSPPERDHAPAADAAAPSHIDVEVGDALSEDSVVVKRGGTTLHGSSSDEVGCWFSDGDNYGADERPNGISACGDPCEAGDAGPTASGDLGSDPREARESNEAGRAEAFARIRFPSEGSYRVCYRRAGVNSWQFLPHIVSTTAEHTFTVIPAAHRGGFNVTWHMNDTRVATWGAMEVHDTSASLTTMPSTFHDLSVAADAVHGQTIKLVRAAASCDTGAPFGGLIMHDAGLLECPLGVCTEVPCAQCAGRADDSHERRGSVFYYLRVPSLPEGVSLRVCFRAQNNWYQLLSRDRAGLGYFSATRAAPRFTYTLDDRRAMTQARLVLRRDDGGLISTFPHRGILGGGGDIVRIVPNTTTCDVTWAGPSPNFVASAIAADLGVWCIAADTSAACHRDALHRSSDGINATFPHYDVNTEVSAWVPAAVAAATIPLRIPQVAHRVCVRQRGVGNWIEVAPQLTPAPPPPFAHWPFIDISGGSMVRKEYIAGSFDFLVLRSDDLSTPSIELQSTIVKLVRGTATCNAPAVGTPTSPFESFSIATHRGARIVEFQNESISIGVVAAAKVFMTFPVLDVAPHEDTVIAYRVCVASRTATPGNWADGGHISVTSLAIGYAATAQPLAGAAFRLVFSSFSARKLDTTPGGDAFKLVPRSSPCAENQTNAQPALFLPFVTSLHAGLELPTQGIEDAASLTAGIANLGPEDMDATANAEVVFTLPHTAGRKEHFRICYRPKATQRWMEIPPVPPALRVYNADTSSFIVHPSGVHNLIVGEAIRGTDPSPSTTYHGGISYDALTFAGAATMFDPASVGATGGLESHIVVTGEGLSAGDKLRLLRMRTETSPGVWTARVAATCADVTVELTVNPHTSIGTTSLFAFNLPLTPGIYLVCYQKAGASSWIQPATDAGEHRMNPLIVVSSSVFLRERPGDELEVVDSTTLNGTAHAALSMEDFAYAIPAASGACGVANSFDGQSPAAARSAVAPAVAAEAIPGAVHVKLRVASDWFPIATRGSFALCYYRAWGNTTVASTASVVPPLRAGTWLQVPIFVSERVQNVLQVDVEATSLVVACPPLQQWPAGSSFEVSVSIVDQDGNVLPSLLPREITASRVVSGVSEEFSFENRGGQCSVANATGFSVPASNPIVATTTGVATFIIVPTSSCGVSADADCTLGFTSFGVPSSPTCTFRVAAAPAVDRLVFTHAPSMCHAERECNIRLNALSADGSRSMAARGDALISTTVHPGMAISINGQASISEVDDMPVPIISGQLRLSLIALVADVTEWSEANAIRSVTVNISFAGVKTSHTFSMERPTLARIQILELHAVEWNGTGANSVAANQNSKWEPSGSSPQFWSPNASAMSQNIVNSVPLYPLVAGQYYKVTLTALDREGRVLARPELIGPSNSITIDFDEHMESNRIIGAPPSAEQTLNFEGPLLPQPFDSVTKSIIFRVKNSENCTRASGCRLRFRFGGSELLTPTFIQTPVRSRATGIAVRCGLGVAEGVAPVFTGSQCPQTTVEVGLSVELEAVDSWGIRDEFFNGDFFVFLETPSVNNGPSRVSHLRAQNKEMGFLRAVNGVAVVRDLTLLRPCFNVTCELHFASDWNIERAVLQVSFAPSTTNLACPLSVALPYFLMSNDRTHIVRRVGSGDSALTARVAVYPDTDLCFTVAAAAPSGERTLYEDAAIHYRLVGVDEALAVAATPSARTPYSSRALNHSRAEFCFNVDGDDGATFRFVFTAESSEGEDQYWDSSHRECLTTVFRLSKAKLIGGLQIVNVAGSGLRPLPNFAAPGANVWSYKQLGAASDETEVAVQLLPIDHYGRPVSPQGVAVAHHALYVSIGRCVSSDLANGVCGEGTGAEIDRSIIVRPGHPVREGGVLRVALLSSTYQVTQSIISFRLRVRQWCLRCEIGFHVYDGTSRVSDAVNGQLSTRLWLSVILPPTIPRYIMFRPGNSPLTPTSLDRDGFVRNEWPLWQASAGLRPVNASRPILFHPSCLDGMTPACKADTRLFLRPMCASDTPDVIGGAEGGNMQLYVVRATEPPLHGEAQCLGDCLAVAGAITAQVDIFSTYTITMGIGSQRLRCVGSTPCINDTTTAVSQTVEALGPTVEEALIALASSQPRATRFRVVGMDASQFFETDPVTGRALSGTPPSARGALHVFVEGGAPHTVGALGTTTGIGDNVATYEFAWRAPRPAAQLVLLREARPAECVSHSTYRAFELPTAAAYTGYAANATLSALSLPYARTTIPVGHPFPFTIEVRDVEGNLVPGASGTIEVSLAGWFGCGSGGAVTVLSGTTTMTAGRATVWAQFSAPCEACALRFVLHPSASQAAVLGSLFDNELLRRVVATPLRIVDYLPMSARTVFSTSPPELQPGNVSIDHEIAFSAAAFSNIGPMAAADPAAPLEVAAYVRISSNLRMLIVGNGGILRLGSQQVNFHRHAVRASGTGSVTLAFAFQRTCVECAVQIQWLLPRTGVSAAFTLRHSTGTLFSVRAPVLSPIIFGRVARMLNHTESHSIAVWTAQSSAHIPFAGYSPVPPEVVDPNVTVLDARSGQAGQLVVVATKAFQAVIYHLRVEEPCYECRLHFGPVVHDCIFRPVATHYRITRLAPPIIRLGDQVTLEAYASDAKGFIDPTIGGISRCDFVEEFFCFSDPLPLAIMPSQDGRRGGFFFPTSSFMSMGGPAAPDFALIPMGPAFVRGGETPPGGIRFRIEGAPVARCIPIISDAFNRSSASYPTFAFRVDLGLDGLQLVNNLPGYDAQVFQPFEVLVAFTLQNSSTGVRFVAPTANSTVRVSFSGECPVQLERPDGYFERMRMGIASFRMLFVRRSIGQICRMHFTSVAGNVACTSAGMCSTLSEVIAFERPATSWDLSRPSAMENGENFVGPRYAAVGRAQIITAQLWERTSLRSVHAQSCGFGGCSLFVSPSNCNPVPDVVPRGGAQFNQNGTATLHIRWAELRDPELNNTLQPYECTLLTRIIGAAIEGPGETSFTVRTCNTARLALLLNHTRIPDIASGRLFTGSQYPFRVAMHTHGGELCRGDSQVGVSTLVNISLVNEDGTPASDIDVINLNTTTAPQSTATLGHGYANLVHLANGQFQFSVVFSNTTEHRSRGLVRLRFHALSTTPQINQILLSPPFEILPSFSRLAILPPLPPHLNSRRVYVFRVIATDAVPHAWLAQRGLPPNIGTGRSDSIFMEFNPSFRRSVPLNFLKGAPMASLVAGQREYEVQFNITTGAYDIRFYTPTGALAPTEQQNMTVQQPRALAIRTLEFRNGTADLCVSQCTLPRHAFDDDGEALNTTTATAFDFSVVVMDEDGFPMLSEEGVDIVCRAAAAAAAGDDSGASGGARSSRAVLALAPALITRGELRSPVIRGHANFTVAFVGHTRNLTESHAPVRLECVAEDLALRDLPPATSKPIHVEGYNESEALSLALRNAAVIKIPTTLTTVASLDRSLFISRIYDVVRRAGVGYVTSENREDVLSLVACQVNRDFFGFADLRGSVCGPRRLCTAQHTECPPHVWVCSCPDAPVPASLTRHMRIMQMFGVDVQLELTIWLERAPGFRAVSVEAVEGEYARIVAAIVEALSTPSNPEFSDFMLVHDTILTTTVLSPSATAFPTPTPENFTDPFTPIPPPSPSGAASTLVSLGLMLVTTLALLFTIEG